MEKPMKKSKLPKTDSIEKLAKFWDTRDLTNFEDELEEVAEPVFARAGPQFKYIWSRPRQTQSKRWPWRKAFLGKNS